jgi:hypothetical protein
MPTQGTDRQRLILIGIAVMAVALTAVALRSLTAASLVAEKALPASGVDGMGAYLAPLPDSSRLAGASLGTMVVDRDPFGSATAAAPSSSKRPGATTSRPTAGGNRQWVVSSILFEDSKRSAIVNNAWVTVGDPLGGGARITAIERKHVVVTDTNGTRHIVPIQGGVQ